MEAPVRISVASVEPSEARWVVTFEITNLTRQELTLDEAWLPHGKFRGEGHTPLAVHLNPGQASHVTCRVCTHEPPGTVVKNAFLILRVSNTWRVFTRMRIEFNGTPRPVVEAVTVQSLQSEVQ